MPRPATGTIIEKRNAAGGINRTLRFNVNGRKRAVALGQVTRTEAEQRLRHELADVERGQWAPPAGPERAVRADVPSFHTYAEQWWLLRETQLAESTKADYRWRLERHLLPYFGEMRLDAIKAATVEGYCAAKLGEDDPLSPRSVNMTVILLGAILERAVAHELILRNPAKGCRVRARAPKRSYLDTAAQIAALLDAAGELDRSAAKDRTHVHRRAMLATLTYAGLRIGELLALRWRDVDLASGWLTVGDSKTDAGRRKVKIRGALRDELAAVRHGADGEGYVFPTRTGRRSRPENFRSRVLAVAVKRANANLAEAEQPPLPEGLTPHSLRRTFCSLLYALGESPPVVMQEMGHTDPGLALKVYAQAIRLDEAERAQLAALVDGEAFGHSMDTNATDRASSAAEHEAT